MLQSAQLTMTDFYFAWSKLKIQFSEKAHSQSTRSILSEMKSREESLFNNEVVVSCMLLDPRLQVMLTPQQQEVAFKHLHLLWMHITVERARKLTHIHMLLLIIYWRRFLSIHIRHILNQFQF